MITLTQPNDITFTGRIWGDEFFCWAETEAGYRFVQSGDGWYYYATLDGSGEFTKTIYKVGIDSPPAGSYQLERTQARIDEINQQIVQFNEQIESNRQWFAQKQAEAQGQPLTLKVGIILIEFKDVKHFDPDEFPRLGGYLTADFDSMMFSYNYWYDLTVPSPHPENELVFGSFRDYWHQMSNGKLKIIGKVVNPDTTGDGVPEWIMADTTRPYYADNFSLGHDTLANEAIQKAIDREYISEIPGDSNYYDKYAIVYAQNAIAAGALMVNGHAIGGKYHFLAERSGPNLFGGDLQDKSFTHIGIYLHEFGHNLGFLDEYQGPDGNHPSDLKYFCLMARGIYNGPDRKSACPATLSPWWRIEYEWLPEPTLISSDTSNFLVEYDYNYPKLYNIDPVGLWPDMHYLFEIKKRQGIDSYIPEPPETYQDQSGTLLIWQHNIASTTGFTDRIRLKTADFSSTVLTQIEDFFPSSDYQNYQCLNDTTYPTASVGIDQEELTPNLIQPAHFAINGIQKLANGNTLIDEILLNHPLKIVNRNAGSWQTISVPHYLNNYSLQEVFPSVDTNSVFKYQPPYVQVKTLANGPGYYAKFPTAPQTITLIGIPIEYLEVDVHTGWNIVGSIAFKVPVPNVCTEPPGLIIGQMYYYDGGYHYLTANDSISPGIGYWVKTSSNGSIILDRYSEPCELNKITSYSQLDFMKMDKFMVSDSAGNFQTLFVSNTDIDSSIIDLDTELPPFFPELDFDSRFEYNEFVKKVSADSGVIDLNILVHTEALPVSLSWEINPENGINYTFIGDSLLGKEQNIETLTGEASFNKLSNNKIQLFAKVNGTSLNKLIPKEYNLFQNFPNPFNPTTIIKYDIPKNGLVTLKVYDILGSEVATLVNEEKSIGRYEINFDASALASGVYIYQLSVNDFISSKKMILIK